MLKSERRGLLVVLAAAASLVAVALAYSPAMRGTLVWDDHTLVERDQRWREASLLELFTRPLWPELPLADARTAYYRPLVLLSFRLDAALGGTSADLHFSSVAFHIVACGLLARVAARLGASGPAAVLAALAWGLAPRLTESVAWVSGRTDVLAGMFSLAALLLSPDTRVHGSRRTPKWLAPASLWVRAGFAGLALLAALLCKEVALATAAALVVGALVRRADEAPGARRQRLLRIVPSVAVPLVIYAALWRNALGSVVTRYRELGAFGRFGTVLEAAGRYVEMTFDPFHPRTSIGMLGELDLKRAVLGALALGIALLAAARFARRASLGIAVAATLSATSLGLVLQLIPLNLQGAVTADRLLYLPLAGLAIALAVAAEQARLEKGKARTASGVVLAASYISALVTNERATEYGDEVVFWLRAAEGSHPHNTAPRSLLASVVREYGRVDLACALLESSRVVQESASRAHSLTHRRTLENLGTCWARAGRYDDARRLFESLVQQYPNEGRVHLGLAYVRFHTIDLDGARDEFRRAAALDPNLGALANAAIEDVELARRDAPALLATLGEREPAEGAHGSATGSPLGATERLARAKLLARVGRLREAEQAWLAITLDAGARVQERGDGLRFLVLFGSVPAARLAADACSASGDVDMMDTWERLHAREARYARVLRQEHRIVALARTL